MRTPLSSPPRRDTAPRTTTRRRRSRATASLLAQGEPFVWLTGGALILCVAMIVGLLALVFYQGTTTFWPVPVVSMTALEGRQLMGEVTREESYAPAVAVLEQLPPDVAPRARGMLDPEGEVRRRLLRTGNFELTQEHFRWVVDYEIEPGTERLDPWSVVFERLEWGRFYGVPRRFLLDGEVVAQGPEDTWESFLRHHDGVRERWAVRQRLRVHEMGSVNHRLEELRLALREVELEHGKDSPEWQAMNARLAEEEAECSVEFQTLAEQVEELRKENDRYDVVVATADGREQTMALEDIVRAYPANQLSLAEKWGVYFSRWWEFLSDDPRAANSEGGVFPALFGTCVMTVLMSLMVVPFGVLAALYLREYARGGALISSVRIAINNLAGVPSIVFGVFGLGFFCYIIGGSIDEWFYSARLPSPTFGTGGILWASLTLALLTLPVVIVATEESLAAVPSSMREGSYACGASKWQTIRRIVLPRAMPGIMTGMILAMARGAGEVAPLMLVGAVKLAPDLPVDLSDWSGSLGPVPLGPIHADRSFMHLGFHIYDLGFQSQNSEAAKPMVFTTTLLLIALIVVLNLTAIRLRTRLRRKFATATF